MQAFLRQYFPFGDPGFKEGYTQSLSDQPTSATGSIYLNKHQHLRLHHACGWVVHAVTGAVWITQDGDTRDIVLESGDSFVLDRNHTAVLSPLHQAELKLEPGTCRQAGSSRTKARQTVPSALAPALRGLPA